MDTKKSAFAWASEILRIIFIVVILTRISLTCFGNGPAAFSSSFNLREAISVWVLARFFIDFIFLGLVFLRFDRIWVAPVTFLWLTTQTIISMENYCGSYEGVKRLLIPLTIALFCGLILHKIMTGSGIRGRILVVCLVSAALPMFYLSLALAQQTRMLVDNAFFPIARTMIESDVMRLNVSLVEKMSTDFPKFLGAPLNASGVIEIPAASESAYRARAASFGFSISDFSEVRQEWASDTCSFDFIDVPIDILMDVFRKKFCISYELRGHEIANKKVTFHAYKKTFEEALQQLREMADLNIIWENGILVVSSAQDTGSSTLRLAHASGGDSSNTGFKKFIDFFGRHKQPYEMMIALSPWELKLEIRIPRYENGRIISGAIVVLDLGKWMQDNIDHEQETGNYQTKWYFPGYPGTLKKALAGYERCQDGGTTGKIDWEALNIESGNWGVSAIWADLKEASSTQRPYQEDLTEMRNFEISSPEGRKYILQSWHLPFCASRIFVSIPSDLIWSSLFHDQVKTLIYCVLSLLMAAFMSIIYSDRLSRPIREISLAAKEIRDGRLDVRIPSQTGDAEIEELAASLDLMAQRLTGRIDVANRQLLMEKGRFETLIESTREGIFLLGRDGRLLYANHAGRQLLGAITTESDFSVFLKSVGVEFQPPLPEPWNPELDEFKSFFHLPCGLGDGDRKIVALYIRSCNRNDLEPGIEGGGSVFIAVLRDITVEKEIDRMKSDFVSQVSHELRTPLTSIKAYTEMLLDEEVDDPETRKEYLRITYDEAERLTRLINDLLDIARIESGRRPLKLGEFDIVRLTRDIAEVMRAQIEKSHQALSLNLPQIPVPIIGDGDLLKQAGLNLLSNASKYTPTGGKIEIAVESGNGSVIWKFTDNGIGLSAKDKEHLFNKFFRVDSDFVQRAGGTGLGLALVKNIVDLHQGEITVVSFPEKGSVFSLVLPSGRS
ncbi:MAG: HAMP domain-containing protein [Candidatus Riflebacteria bacterium]|nr:HAMP domain-containing protein [Candidatus Riflebacteria bacterium]